MGPDPQSNIPRLFPYIQLRKHARYLPLDANRFVFLHADQQNIIELAGGGDVIRSLLAADRSATEKCLQKHTGAVHWLLRHDILEDPTAPSIPPCILQQRNPSPNSVTIYSLEDEMLPPTLEPALRQAGFALASEGEFALIPVLDYLHPRLLDLIPFFRQSQTTWALMHWDGPRAWAGPVFRHNASGCYRCLRACLAENRWIGAQTGESIPTGPMGPLDPAVAQWITHSLAALVDDDPNTFHQLKAGGATQRHIFRSHPSCPHCLSKPVPKTISARSPNAAFPSEPRTVSPEETIHLLRPLVSPLTGILRDLQPVHTTGRNALHSYYARHIKPAAPAHYRPSEGLIPPGSCSSRGWTPAEAEAACLAEAVERYSICFRGDEPVITATFHALATEAIHPAQILNFSAAQWNSRYEWNARTPELKWRIPHPLHPATEVEWVRAESLSGGPARWLPAALCLMNYRPHAHPWIGDADSTGCASANTKQEAIFHALLEAMERDAVGIAWYNQTANAEVDLDTISDPTLAVVLAELRAEGWRLRAFDITTGLQTPVFFCLARHPESGWLWSAGAHPQPAYAFSRALSEMWQLTQGPGRTDALPEPIFAGLPIHPAPHGGTLCQEPDPAALIQALTADGLHPLCVDLTNPAIAFPVVRVVVPGLCHSKPRFGAARLYSLPERKSESELNPICL